MARQRRSFTIPHPIPEHHGFAVTHYEEEVSPNGVAFRVTVAYQGREAVWAENRGRGGPDLIDYAGPDVKAAFLALADGVMLDSEGAAPVTDESEILEVLISTYECEQRSVNDTVMRAELPPPDPQQIQIRETYVFKTRLTIEQAREYAPLQTPPCVQWYVPGKGWEDLQPVP